MTSAASHSFLLDRKRDLQRYSVQSAGQDDQARCPQFFPTSVPESNHPFLLEVFLLDIQSVRIRHFSSCIMAGSSRTGSPMQGQV